MARYPNGVRFKHKRPVRPDKARITFKLLRAMKDFTGAEISRRSWVAPGTISKLRTRRTRYPSSSTIEGICNALGLELSITDKDGNKVE